MRRYFAFTIIILIITSCSVKPPRTFSETNSHVVPDYQHLKYWAAHPEIIDLSDSIIEPGVEMNPYFDKMDVFFLHPTTYTGDRGENQWNAPINNAKLNKKTDESAIFFQASLFNTVGALYAPRYRQAHFSVYTSRKTHPGAIKAVDLAYSDVEKAFLYYIENWNQGKPFIIASHSQGTTHAVRLIQDHIEGRELAKQMISAYLVGMPVPENSFKYLVPCEVAEQTHCFCSWRTFKKDYIPRYHIENNNVVATNPINWTRKDTYASVEEHLGAVIFPELGYLKGLVDAQVYDGMVWVTKPKFRGSWLLVSPNYHRGDYNLFYANVRENAIQRSVNYFRQSGN